tara:strand:- start:6223 stop:6501 length:279 start_codon:yes stop_codon:yes gene_type:complete
MILPPVSNEYLPEVQSEIQTQIREADENNLKKNKDNFFDLTKGSLVLKSSNGNWYRLGIDDSGNLTTSLLSGSQLDSSGRPQIATDNPYVGA